MTNVFIVTVRLSQREKKRTFTAQRYVKIMRCSSMNDAANKMPGAGATRAGSLFPVRLHMHANIVAATVTTLHVDDPVNLVQDHVVYLGCANVGDEDDAAGSGKAMPLLLLPTSTS